MASWGDMDDDMDVNDEGKGVPRGSLKPVQPGTLTPQAPLVISDTDVDVQLDSKMDYIFADIVPHIRKRLQVDDVALYSVTPAWMSIKINSVLRNIIPKGAIITDATACVGGDTMRFCKWFRFVNAVEVNSERARMLLHNVTTMGLSKMVNVVNQNYANCYNTFEQDVVYVDAPWGGPEYKHRHSINLFLNDIPLAKVCLLVWPRTTVIALKVPTNFNVSGLENDVLSGIEPHTCTFSVHTLHASALLLVFRRQVVFD